MKYVVVEGNFDELLLRKLLIDLDQPFQILVANGRDAARPIARKILLQNHQPTAFVFDTDTTEDWQEEEQLLSLKDYFSMYAFEVGLLLVPFTPSIEIVFFDRAGPIVQRLGHPLEWELEVASKVAPKRVLEQYVKKLGYPDQESFVADLTDTEIEDLQQHPQITRLRHFISKKNQ